MDQVSKEASHEIELNFVRDTYDNIASDFSGTRYKKWPKVEKFIENLPRDALLLDIGCGNGKYLDNAETFNIGCDSSSKLLSICKQRGFEVVKCDMKRLPFKRSQFDAIICIAALHHIVTHKARQECLESMSDLLIDDHGKLLIQVWSYEQELEKDNPYLKQVNSKHRSLPSDKVALTKEHSLCGNLKIPVHKNRTPFANQDVLVPFNVRKKAEHSKSEELVEHLRYYHVFKENELETMISQIPRVRILDSYYDRGNWCAIITKIPK